MRIWEVYDSPSYEERRGGRGRSSMMYRGGGRGSSYNQHDAEEDDFDEGYNEGYRDAMTHVYGERNIRRSGSGLGHEVWMRVDDEFMPDAEMYHMRRRRDSRGKFM